MELVGFCFNPCFNGTMYKNPSLFVASRAQVKVSILVLMELCIKTLFICYLPFTFSVVSILVLMELCIKTVSWLESQAHCVCFNPCFNGTMYKNHIEDYIYPLPVHSFNPCFNGTMYKNDSGTEQTNQSAEFQSLF